MQGKHPPGNMLKSYFIFGDHTILWRKCCPLQSFHFLGGLWVISHLPSQIKMDNGPPFNSDDYTWYLKALGISARLATPKWPQGNAEAERFMQPLGKTLKIAHIEGRPWQQELNCFLQYRTTPHTSTKVPPAELLFNHPIKGRLPILDNQDIVNRHKTARQSEMMKQKYNKQYADSRRNTKNNEIKVGDHVLVRQECKNKLTPNFNPNPYVVTSRQYLRVTARG